MQIQELLDKLDGVKGTANKWVACCPCKNNHSHDDKNRSLSISLSGTKILLHCHTGCSVEEICSALEIKTKDLFTDSRTPIRTTEEKRQSFINWYAEKNNLRFIDVYSYCYGQYNDGLCKIKFSDNTGHKTFRWIHDEPAAKSGFKLSHEGCRHRLYVAGDIDDDDIYIVEGEKDADTFFSLTGKTAVSAENGAQRSTNGSSKWLDEYTAQLKRKKICILHDNDEAGRVFSEIERAALEPYVKSVQSFDITRVWPECPEKGDVTDLYNALGRDAAVASLDKLFSGLPEITLSPSSADDNPAILLEEPKTFDLFLKKIQTKTYKPLETGIKEFDDLLGGGIMKQSLIILSASPATGKTTLAQQIFENMARNGTDVIFLNLEMSGEQLLARYLSRLIAKNGGSVSASEVLQGYNWSKDQKEQVMKAAEEYRKYIAPHLNYNPYDSNADLQTITETLSVAADSALQDGKDAPVAVVDYLHLVTSGTGDDQTGTIKKTVKALKDYAVKYNTFVFAISATNRTSNAGGVISLDSGRDSSAIEYTADVALSLNYAALHNKEKLSFTDSYGRKHENEVADARDPDHMEYLQGEKPRRMVVQVLKNRLNSPGGKLYLSFDAESGSFSKCLGSVRKKDSPSHDSNPSILSYQL